MNASNHKPDDELRALLSGLFDDDLSDEEFAGLSQRLHDDPEARAAYFEAAALEVNLEHLHAPALGRGHASSHRPGAATRRLARQSLAAAAVVALLIALAMAFFRSPAGPEPAALRFCGNSEWTVDGRAGLASAGLTPGSRLVIEQGVAELALPNEVRAVVEAPATVHLVDMRTVGLTRGRAYFEVRSAEGRGFTVVTPRQRIVDLGTAFGVLAGGERTELEVIEGRVRVDASDGTPGETLSAPMRVRLEGARVAGEMPDGTTGFLRELPSKVETVFEDDFQTGLAPGKEYAVILGPDLVRDLDGNRFTGMEDPESWTFRTEDGFPVSLPLRNPGFEEDAEPRNKGESVAHWHPAADGWGWGVDESRGGLVPTEGRFFGRVFKSYAFVQDSEVPIVAGTTYALRLDVGLADSAATISLFGSDGGRAEPLAEKTIRSSLAGWQRDCLIFFTAREEHATGQTLGIALKHTAGDFAAFDRLRLGSSGPTQVTRLPDGFGAAAEAGEAAADIAGPVVVALHPVRDAANAPWGDMLAIRFDEPICFGFGHLLIRNVGDWRESKLMAADARMQIDGRVLTIRPPLGLRDGERHLGRIPGWEGDAWAGVFNPAGDGTWYRNPEFADTDVNRKSGVAGAMRGSVMATFADAAPGTSIRRRVGDLEPGKRYAVKVTLGVRDSAAAEPAVFDGYTIRLLAGDRELAAISDDAPPGPPNQVTTVGFSWDASELPDGVAVGHPLWLEISPNQASADRPGYLDLDHVKLTRLPQ